MSTDFTLIENAFLQNEHSFYTWRYSIRSILYAHSFSNVFDFGQLQLSSTTKQLIVLWFVLYSHVQILYISKLSISKLTWSTILLVFRKLRKYTMFGFTFETEMSVEKFKNITKDYINDYVSITAQITISFFFRQFRLITNKGAVLKYYSLFYP